ncbi:MAG: hypothetical protein AAFV90_14205 [Cyanobacteria bacterium J06634_5]
MLTPIQSKASRVLLALAVSAVPYTLAGAFFHRGAIAQPEPETPATEAPATETPAVEEATPEQMPPTTTPAAAPEFVTLCSYDPNSGTPNPFGMRAFVSISEVEGNSVFRYEQFPSFVTAEAEPQRQADIASESTLTMYQTPIAEARQLMVDNPEYYAALLDVAESDLGDRSFAEVNDLLACQDVSDPQLTQAPESPASPPESPAPETPAAPEPEPEPAPEPETGEAPATESDMTIADLPDGNYRFVAAEFPNRVVTDEELLEAGGAVFLFRKFDENVTGSYGVVDHEGGVCISGTVQGDTVTGKVSAYSELIREDNFLTVDDALQGIITLESFSRINAGTRLPVESCPDGNDE